MRKVTYEAPDMPAPEVLKALPKVKAPRKPRPSEVAAKAKKPAPKKKKAAAKPKVRHKKQGPKKLLKRSVAKPKKPKPKAKKAAAVIARPERLDLRLSKKEKAKLVAKAKATRRTVTSVVLEMIEKLK
jgi:hypothetical protein